MGTAEVDGTFDAGHSNEPPSIRTVAILKDHLRGAEPQLGLVLHIGDLSYARGYDAQWD
ncbi:unnamed protein product, partial [Hapterophycus canaliculatus]